MSLQDQPSVPDDFKTNMYNIELAMLQNVQAEATKCIDTVENLKNAQCTTSQVAIDDALKVATKSFYDSRDVGIKDIDLDGISVQLQESDLQLFAGSITIVNEAIPDVSDTQHRIPEYIDAHARGYWYKLVYIRQLVLDICVRAQLWAAWARSFENIVMWQSLKRTSY
ncbi:hypothetical protein MN608_11658 [Microdochium nivale]|nr:hypothetical protein MN608_11658 [Microdochium nivale]